MCLMLCFYLFSSSHIFFLVLLPFLSCTHKTILFAGWISSRNICARKLCVYFENYKLHMNLFIIFFPFVRTTFNRILLPFNSSIQNFQSTNNNLLLQFSLGDCCKTLCSIFGFINTERESTEDMNEHTGINAFYSFVRVHSLLLCSLQNTIGSHYTHAGKICDHVFKKKMMFLF